MSTPFLGMTESDFDAYHPSRAGSNAYVRPRLPVKEKLLDVAHLLAKRAGSATERLDVDASEERPSVWNQRKVTEQWVFLWRDKEARAQLDQLIDHTAQRPATATNLFGELPWFHHAFLALRLDHESIDLVFRVHAHAMVDINNFKQRLEQGDYRTRIAGRFRAMPADTSVGVVRESLQSVSVLNVDDIAASIDQAVKLESWWSVVRSCPRARALTEAGALMAWFEETFDHLLGIYQNVAWRKDDDVLAIAEKIAADRAEREAHRALHEAEEAERQVQAKAEIDRRREAAVNEARERQAALEPARRGAVMAAVGTMTPAPVPTVQTPPPATVQPSVTVQVPVVTQASVSKPVPRAPVAPQANRGPAQGGQGRAQGNPTHAQGRPQGNPRPPEKRVEKRDEKRDDRRSDRPRQDPPRSVVSTASTAPKTTPSNGERSGQKELVPNPNAAPTVGARVKINVGPFSGRLGTVVEIDSHGVAKVSFGALSIRVEVASLAVMA